MAMFAGTWYIWFAGMLLAYVYVLVKNIQIFVSILNDDRETFEFSIYGRIRDYGLAIALSLVFLVLLIISGITELVIRVC